MSAVSKKLGKCGNSSALFIPPTLLEILGWEIGTDLELSVEADGDLCLVVRKEKPAKFKLFKGEK
jgi:antitoxin component of MazEF toxin-antitoxin module